MESGKCLFGEYNACGIRNPFGFETDNVKVILSQTLAVNGNLSLRLRPQKLASDSRFGEIFACGIRDPLGFGIRNPTKDWNPESQLH